MDRDRIPILLGLLGLLLLSAFFSATETAFSSLNPLKLKSMAATGKKAAARTLAVHEQYDKLLTTILIGNNVVNIAMSAIATVWFVAMLGEEKGAGVSTAAITLVVLIFGEITPKILAKECAEQYAMAVTPLIRGIVFLLTPVGVLVGFWKKLLLKLFRFREGKTVTEEDLLTIVEEAETVGELDSDESEIIRSAIAFRELEAGDVLTPRVRMTAVELTADQEEIRRIFRESEYSRLPVYSESIDNIEGVLNQKDFFEQMLFGEKSLKEVMKPVKYVSESAKIVDLLGIMREERMHMVIVADEYGGTAGLLTMEDILEELVGEIYDEYDEEEPTLRVAGEGFRLPGGFAAEAFFRRFGIARETDAATVGGFVMEQLERIPVKGDGITVDGVRILVTKVRDHAPVELYVKIEGKEQTVKNDG